MGADYAVAAPHARERDRLQALHELEILDTPPEEVFSDLTELAASICGTPIALLTLVDADRQWFKARFNFDIPETPRDVSFCAHAIHQSEVMVVEDAVADPRFAGNPLVQGDPNIRFYAGAPLVTREGLELGTLCVIDREPRQLGPREEQALTVLSRHASALLDLRLKERMYRRLLEIAPDGVLVLDGLGRIRFANEAMAEMIGLDDERQLIDRGSVWPLIIGRDRERVRAILGDATSGLRRTVRLETRLVDSAGGERPVDLAAGHLQLSGQPMAKVLVRDLTERYEAAALLTTSRQQLQSVVDHAPVSIAAFDLDGRYTLANVTHLRWYAIRPDCVDRRPEEVHGEAVAGDLRRLHRQVIAEDRGIVDDAELPLPGGRRVLRRVAFILRDSEGNPYGVSMISRDVSEERAHAAAQARLREELSRTDRLRAIGQLAGGVAHDVNNVLAVILSSAELLTATLDELDEVPQDLDAAIRTRADAIMQAATAGAGVTSQLLAVAHDGGGVVEPVDLGALVTRYREVLGHAAGPTTELTVDLSAELPPVAVDPAKLEQALLNLVINARDALPGRGRILVRTTRTTVGVDRSPELMPLSPGEYVIVSVVDDGVGMAPEVAARAFDAYFTTKPPTRGSGLGLATVYGTATGVGGIAVIDTEPGAGTTVSLYLPAAPVPAVAPSQPQPLPRLVGGGRRVLVVDDQPHLRGIVAEALHTQGFDVVAVADATAAIAAWRDHTGEVDLVVTDEVMPGMTGTQLIRWLRVERPELPCVLMSGFAKDIDDVTVLPKPFALGALLARVGEALGESATARLS